jgi:DnaJ-class molecular chaperone
MNNGKNPYEIMGLPRNSTVAQVKTRYFELARKHHPDKLDPSTSDEDKKNHEEIFKEITNAYSKINKQKEFENKFGLNPNEGSGESTSFFNMSDDMQHEDWRSVWAGLESLFNRPDSWERMKNIVTDTIKDTIYEVAMHNINKTTKKWKETSLKRHNITVPVTLEEVHLKKQKKLRLFLTGIKLPVFITLDIGEYPETSVEHIVDNNSVFIDFTMELIDHPLYRMDDLLESWDLWALQPIKITWNDYLCGKTVPIDYIDGTKIDIVIEPFNIKNPHTIYDKGLCGLGNLYIGVDLEPPNIKNKEKWQKLDNKFKGLILKHFDELYAPEKS